MPTVKEIDYTKLNELYAKYENKEITKSDMAKSLMVTLPTLNKWIDKYIISKNEKPETELSVIDKSDNDKIKVFSNDEFGSIRTLEIDGEPWFVGKDVAEVLGYANPSKAVSVHTDKEDRNYKMIDITHSQNGNVLQGQTKTTFINESGLYSLILSSKLPTAKKFRR